MNILSVLVLYNCKIEESKTFKSFLLNFAKSPQEYQSFKLIIYDNSKYKQEILLDIPFKYEYVHNHNNPGVAKAYNYALKIAKDSLYDWLLILDQDTFISEDFFLKMFNIPPNIIQNQEVVACVPKIFYKDTFFSPSKVLWGGIHRPIAKNFRCISDREIMAIGSGVLVRKSFLLSIHGFNEEYWLDCLDRWLFNTIYSFGKKVYVIDSIIEHDLSILNFDKFMNEKRYLNQLKYETVFMEAYKTKIENIFFLIRLLRRSLVLLFTAKNKNYFKITLKHLLSLMYIKVRHAL